MENLRHSPSPEKRGVRQDREYSSRSNTPDNLNNTEDNTSNEDFYNEDPTNSTNTSIATTPVCCIDSKSHHLPPPPSQFPSNLNVNSYPICDIPMQSVPSVPQQQVIYANTPSNRGDHWQNRTRDVPVVTTAGRSHVSLQKGYPDQLVNPNEIYAKVDKTRKKNTKSKTPPPTYENTVDMGEGAAASTAVIAEPKRKETKVTVEKTSPVEASDIPRAAPNTNIAVAFVVTCCFNLPLGLLAIYCSLAAAKAFRDGKNKKGERRNQISMFLSLFGILITVLIVMGVVLHLAMSSAGSKKKKKGASPVQGGI